MTRAVRKMAKDCADGKMNPDEIDETLYESYLDTHGIPDPDLLIRTSGELRLSNYLLVAACLYRILFYGYSMAGFYKRRIRKGN